MHGGSGAGYQTVAAALISGRGISPGREVGTEDAGGGPVGGTPVGRRRDKEERLRDAQASISISLNDHAERVAMKAQRIRDGTWPSAVPNPTSAREKLDALRERIRAKALVAAGGAEARRQDGASVRRGQGGGVWPSDVTAPALRGDDAQHRGEREQLEFELPLELRTSQANEASQMHSVSRLGGGAGGGQDDGFGGAGGRSQVAELARWPQGDDSLAGGSGGAALPGEAIRTAAAVAASFAAWHSDAAGEAP